MTQQQRHIYSTEGSDRKHGALRMIGKCSCGWQTHVIEGQGKFEHDLAKDLWREHLKALEEK